MSLTFEATGSSQTKEITCSGAWHVGNDNSWISVAPRTGTGDDTITITVASNPDAVESTGTVTVTSSDNPSLKKVFTITQKAQTTD